MKNLLIILLSLSSFIACSQVLTNGTNINITKTWPQAINGYTYSTSLRVPAGSPPSGGFPVCILLHGNGGNGAGMINQFRNLLSCHVLVAPSGYQKSWNICDEDSDAPDISMLNDLISSLQNYTNINPGMIRIVGFSNGAGLANRAFIENRNIGVDAICAVVSQLHIEQFHNGGFYCPSGATDNTLMYCGYDSSVVPLNSRKYLSIANTNDQLIPYTGGASAVGVTFLDAETAAFEIAKLKGFTGSKITSGIQISNSTVTEYDYLSGAVVHLKGNAQHGMDSTQKNYIKTFLKDCAITTNFRKIESNSCLIAPNPSSGSFSILQRGLEQIDFQIFEATGQVLLEGKTTNKTTTIDISKLPKGVLFVRINNQLHTLIHR